MRFKTKWCNYLTALEEINYMPNREKIGISKKMMDHCTLLRESSESRNSHPK